MTQQVKLALGTVEVDFSNLGVAVTHRLSNPIIVFDTPRTDLNTSNSVGINIGFVTEAFDLRFTLTDGLGTMDWAVPSTNYEKIFHMAYQRNPKVLTINDKTMTVHIETVNLPYEAGKKDLSIDGILSLRVVMNIEMEAKAEEDEQYPAVFNNGSAYIAIADADVYFPKYKRLYFDTDDTLPTPFNNVTHYWVVNSAPGFIWVSATKNGEPITATSAGAGNHWAEL
jgi:hypothetical protein